MSVLLTLLFLGVVQVALAVHVRNTLVDAAGEGARAGALAGRDPADGVEVTRGLIAGAVSARFAEDVRASVEPVPGGELVVITVEAPLPVIGLIGPQSLEVSGRALREGR